MRTTLITALLRTANLLLPYTHAQQSEPHRKSFEDTKVKAETGDAPAQFKLGLCYANDQGVATNYVEAMKWWRKAAEHNHAEAQYRLVSCYTCVEPHQTRLCT